MCNINILYLVVFHCICILYLHTMCTELLGWNRDLWAPTVPASCGARSKQNPLMIYFYSLLIRFLSIFKSICPNFEAKIYYLRSKRTLLMISIYSFYLYHISLNFDSKFNFLLKVFLPIRISTCITDI